MTCGTSFASSRKWRRPSPRRMAGNLGMDSGVSSRPSSARHSSNPEAYEHYLRGRYQLLKDSVDGLWKAQDHFGRAIKLDSSYALAYSGLADTYALLGSYDVMPIAESHPLGRDAALKALQLDDTLSEAHVSLAGIMADHYWDWGEAERHYKRAIELAPNDVNALRYLFFLSRVHGARRRGFADRRTRRGPGPGVTQRSDERRGDAQLCRSLR